jgi:hypothetical protein
MSVARAFRATTPALAPTPISLDWARNAAFSSPTVAEWTLL